MIKNVKKKNQNITKKYRIKYYKNNELKIKKRNQNRYRNNKIKHIAQVAKNTKKRLKTDPIFKFGHNTRCMVNLSFRRCGLKKSLKTEKIICCSLDFFKNHIISQFQQGMTLKNYGKWEIDHKIPLETAKTEDDVIKLCHFSNLQPMWKIENREKSSKILF